MLRTGLAGLILALAGVACGSAAEPVPIPTWRLQARLVAVGLQDVAGVRQVGRFHSGGPIPGNPEFLLSTGTGRQLDPERVMVAVGSNFGAPLGNPSHAPGAVLSIDPREGIPGTPLVVPKTFAALGAQSEAAGGAILLFTAQSPAFQNRSHNGGAVTADFSAASGPRYLSINNGFGRPWIANAPHGVGGDGTSTVVDPNGRPLDNAPSDLAGGVFVGRITNRQWAPQARPSSWIAKRFNYRASEQFEEGSLAGGALGTAFLGPSPDGSRFAVFAVVTSRGAVAQVHVQDGVDGLAGPGTVGSPSVVDDPGVIGIAFKWTPQRTLYIADAARDRLVLLHLDDDGRIFKVRHTTTIHSPALVQPVDLAAALPEIANPSFASHTTLAGGSDIYVANRGDGSLLRLSQDGRVLARAQIQVPHLGLLGQGRIRAIAVSADAQRLWVTLQGDVPGLAGHDGALIEVSAFDASGPFSREVVNSDPQATISQAQAGEQAFQKTFTPQTGLGPLFNARACVTCHTLPATVSSHEEHFTRHVARMDTVTGRVMPVEHPNSPVARRHSTRGLGQLSAPTAALPRQANVVSLRMPLALFASARLDEIPDIEIAAQAISKGDGIKGRAHYVTSASGELRVGRYGWKAQIATLEEMVADAFVNEIGITSPQRPDSPAGGQSAVEDDGSLVRAVATYLRTLRRPSKDR